MNLPEFPSDFLDADENWCQILSPPREGPSRPALFLDRDGVIVEETLYLHRVEDVALIPGGAETIAAANHRGVPVVVVSNQAGIARGYYGWKEFQEVQQSILLALSRLGAYVDGVFACPHHPDGVGSYVHPAHPARKPQPGMLLRAAELLNLELKHSWMVGDNSSDLLAARAAGLQGGVLVMTGHGPAHRDAANALCSAEFTVVAAGSIGEVRGLIPLLNESSHFM